MSEFVPKTDKEKISYLMATDNRREAHHKELKKDVEQLTKSVNNLISLIAGNDLNGNKGLYSLTKEIESKVDKHQSELQSLNQTIDGIKFWGRGSAGVVFVTLGLMIKKIFTL